MLVISKNRESAVAAGSNPSYTGVMVDINTFLLVLCCCFSVVAIIIAERARNAVVPKKLSSRIGDVEADLEAIAKKHFNHVKQEASQTAVAAKRAGAGGGNGGAIAPGDYAALEARLLVKPERR